MGLFCLLWIPLLYLFRRSITTVQGSRHVWALLFGCAAVTVQYFAGPLVTPGGFGFSRWLSGFIDIVCLPVFVPLAVYWLFYALLKFPAGENYADFALLWIIPVAARHAISWNSHRSPIMLVFVPLLWTALGVGLPFLVNYMLRHRRWYVIALAVFCIVVLPLAATTSWWAFFSHQPLMGSLLLFASLVPAITSLALDFIGTKAVGHTGINFEE